MKIHIGMIEDDGKIFDVFDDEEIGLAFVDKSDEENYKSIYQGYSYHTIRQIEIGHIPYSKRFDHDFELGEHRIELAIDIFGKDSFDIIVDIGCSNGGLVAASLSKGIESIGIDINQEILDDAEVLSPILKGNLFSLDVESNLFPSEIKDKLIDKKVLFFMNDVIEHFRYPGLVMKNILNIRVSSVMLVIDTPNINSDGFRDLGMLWHHVRPVEHPFLYRGIGILKIIYDIDASLNLIREEYPIPGKMVLYFRNDER